MNSNSPFSFHLLAFELQQSLRQSPSRQMTYRKRTCCKVDNCTCESQTRVRYWKAFARHLLNSVVTCVIKFKLTVQTLKWLRFLKKKQLETLTYNDYASLVDIPGAKYDHTLKLWCPSVSRTCTAHHQMLSQTGHTCQTATHSIGNESAGNKLNAHKDVERTIWRIKSYCNTNSGSMYTSMQTGQSWCIDFSTQVWPSRNLTE